MLGAVGRRSRVTRRLPSRPGPGKLVVPAAAG